MGVSGELTSFYAEVMVPTTNFSNAKAELAEGQGGVQGLVEGLGVEVLRAEGEKCERCWKYTADVGTHAQHPTLCARCAAVLE